MPEPTHGKISSVQVASWEWPNRLKHARSGLGMPALDAAVKLLAGIENTVVKILVVYGPSQAIAGGRLRQWGKRIYRILPKEPGR